MSDLNTATPASVQHEQLENDPELSLQLAIAICQRHHLPSDCTRVEGGSRPVFSSAGRYIIKAFAPEDIDFHLAESVFLDRLHGRLPIPTPRLLASGSWGGRPYIVMEQLEGIPLAEAWADLSLEERTNLMTRLGEAVRVLHSLPAATFEAAPFHWRELIEEQRASVLERHRRWGLPESWLSQIPGYLDAPGLDLHDAGRFGPLHTELMREHVFVRRSGSGWTLSGLIDFEPSMNGHAEYEFCAIGLFLTPGDKDLFRRFLTAYGYRDADLTNDLSRRIMAFLLLHRYGNIKHFIGRAPAGSQWTTLHQAGTYWFGL